MNLSAGSPYYNPHLQRPAIFPPSDGYLPPEDPLVGVCRQIDAARQCKQAMGDLPMIGTGYSYLQDYLPHVAQAVVRAGWIDAVGLGRMVLAYPHLPAETLADRANDKKARLSHVQRLHDGAAAGNDLGLLSARFLLQGFAGSGPAEGFQAVDRRAARRKLEREFPPCADRSPAAIPAYWPPTVRPRVSSAGAFLLARFRAAAITWHGAVVADGFAATAG